MQTRDGTQRLLTSTYCPFCTDRYRLPVVQAQDTTDAFSLSNLLPAGTITVAVHDGEPPCRSGFNNRDWHSLPMRKLSTHPADTLFRELAFLAEHRFLRAISRLGASGHIIFIRLYLIPNDLPNVRGRLRCRSKTVVHKGQRYMHRIVPLIEQTDGLWDADEACLDAPQKHFLPSRIDNRTMAEIYSDLPSPILNSPTNDSTTLSHRVASGDAIWGLRTTLYGYQRHSIAVMLNKESNTSPVPDPLYIPVSCMSGTHCYIQPPTMSVLRECPAFSPSRGGILCEELGTGKTIMIIALVLATASQLPDPEESLVERPVMTPLAYHHFPSKENALARDKAGLGGRAIQQVPSLVELLVHYFSSFKVTTGRPAFADELEASHMWPFIQANKPFYHHYDAKPDVEESERPRRQSVPKPYPRTMYLSSATLAIVPLALLGQWKTEIDKHCHDCVRYLIVRPSMDLPDARELALDYELIIMSDFRFRRESKKNKTEKLYDLKSCTCPYLAGSRVPDCHCHGDPDVTPLFQVRWKRLIIDEGHIAGKKLATINCFVSELSIQHKWIVTGTPTSNILGLKSGRTADDQEPSDHYVDSVEPVLDYPQSDSLVAMSPSQDDGGYIRIWGSYDSSNLQKLGTMIGDFIAVPQFRSNSDSFVLNVSTPLRDRRGPRPGAINVLSQVMQMVMVRHRIKDVENDVLLPPMEHDTIYMDLDNYALKSYNAMQASLAINAIDSERKDRDYLFHPSSAMQLQTAINNSFQSLFWSSSDILYNVDEICRFADDYIDRAVNRGPGREASPEDLDLLRQALKHAASAAADDMWRAMQPYADVPFKVSGPDPAVLEAWTRTRLCNGSRTLDVMHPDRLVNLRSLVRKKPLTTRDELVEKGNMLDRNEKRAMASKSRSSPEAKRGVNRTRKMVQEVQEAIEILKKRVERMDVSDDEELEDCQDRDRVNQIISAGAAATRVTKSSPLTGVKIGASLSTKLNYILSEVQRYSAKEKFLIFSNSLLTLFQIGEALSLFEIKHLQYTNQEDPLLREQCVATFETSVVHRVLLIQLKLGARGLNLISASRVIFCEPVWHPDVEEQAIKRVHRIGQTRSVTVKTLVIRSTAEEAMIARRQYLRSSDKVPSMKTESGMRDYLMHPRFLSESTTNDPISVTLSLDDNQAASLIDTQSKSSRDVGGSSRVDVDSYIPAYDSEGRNGDVAARKRVRFEE